MMLAMLFDMRDRWAEKVFMVALSQGEEHAVYNQRASNPESDHELRQDRFCREERREKRSLSVIMAEWCTDAS